MVNAPRPKPHLGNLKALAFTPEDIALWHTDVGEADVHMPVWRVVMTKDMHGAQDVHTGCVNRHQDLGLLAEGLSIW